MSERLAKWNDRYAKGEETHAFVPSPPLPEAIEGIASGLALDLASGAGRHALFLAERGFRVVAVDFSEAGLAILRREAAERGLSDRIEIVRADLEAGEFSIEPGRYDLICDFYFLDRDLFDAIRRGLRPGGLFVAAIHVESGASQASHRFLLAPGELRRTVENWGFEVVLAREGDTSAAGHSRATAEIVARFPRT